MQLPAFLGFTPVPVRDRHDGWTPRRQRLFSCAWPAATGRPKRRGWWDAAANPTTPSAAGGAQAFAAAWDAAQDFARQARTAGRCLPPSDFAFDTILIPRFYRGKLVGYIQREDVRSATRTLWRLDRLSHVVNATEGFDFEALVEQACAGAEIVKDDGISV